MTLATPQPVVEIVQELTPTILSGGFAFGTIRIATTAGGNTLLGIARLAPSVGLVTDFDLPSIMRRILQALAGSG